MTRQQLIREIKEYRAACGVGLAIAKNAIFFKYNLTQEQYNALPEI